VTLITLSTAWLIGIAAVLLWRDDPKVHRIAACGLFLLLGSLRYTLSLPDLSDPSYIVAYRDQGEVTLWGRVVGEPDVRDTYTNLRLAVDRVRIEGKEHAVTGTTLVRTPRYPAYMYGDELEVVVRGTLTKGPFYAILGSTVSP